MTTLTHLSGVSCPSNLLNVFETIIRLDSLEISRFSSISFVIVLLYLIVSLHCITKTNFAVHPKAILQCQRSIQPPPTPEHWQLLDVATNTSQHPQLLSTANITYNVLH